MLLETSFLRNLPGALDPEQRITLNAFVFACDVITYDFTTIRRITTEYGSKIGSISLLDRVALFSHAWSIVDQIHIIRQLFKRIFSEGFGEKTSAFYNAHESATKLRNYMDHLNVNIKNIAEAKKHRPPIYGIISYFFVGNDEVEILENEPIVKSGSIIAVSGGSTTQSKHKTGLVNPSNRDIYLPVSQFALFANDYTFNIEDAVKSLMSICSFLENNLQKNYQTQKREIEQKNNIVINDEDGKLPSQFVLILETRFD
jgi:hypothetical protein